MTITNPVFRMLVPYFENYARETILTGCRSTLARSFPAIRETGSHPSGATSMRDAMVLLRRNRSDRPLQ